MDAFNNFFHYIKSLSFEREVWQVAFRAKSDIPLYKGNGNGFILIPNNARFWRADPFVIKRGKRNYLFAEMYDRKTHKGVIGVARLNGNKCGKFRVCLDLPYHLSYPCIYENSEGVFMIPECCASNELSVYKCISFPHKWEKYKTIQKQGLVDTTPIFDKNQYPVAYITSLFELINGGNDNLYGFKSGNELNTIYKNNFSCRCAGHLIKDEKLIRPIQDDQGIYGNSLYFSEVINDDVSNFKEKVFLQVLPPDSKCKTNQISVSLHKNKQNLKYIGIHTYNLNEDYEVIDLLVERQTNRIVLFSNRHKLLNKYIKKIKSKR